MFSCTAEYKGTSVPGSKWVARHGRKAAGCEGAPGEGGGWYAQVYTVSQKVTSMPGNGWPVKGDRE